MATYSNVFSDEEVEYVTHCPEVLLVETCCIDTLKHRSNLTTV